MLSSSTDGGDCGETRLRKKVASLPVELKNHHYNVGILASSRLRPSFSHQRGKFDQHSNLASNGNWRCFRPPNCLLGGHSPPPGDSSTRMVNDSTRNVKQMHDDENFEMLQNR